MSLITIIIPTFNEKKILFSLGRLVNHLKYILEYQFELIIVDDSNDGTFEILQKNIENLEIQTLIIQGDGQGKGSAIRRGALKAKGSIVFYMDADFTIPIENLTKFIHLIEKENYDLVIGERYNPRTIGKFLDHPIRFLLSLGLLFAQRYFFFISLLL